LLHRIANQTAQLRIFKLQVVFSLRISTKLVIEGNGQKLCVQLASQYSRARSFGKHRQSDADAASHLTDDRSGARWRAMFYCNFPVVCLPGRSQRNIMKLAVIAAQGKIKRRRKVAPNYISLAKLDALRKQNGFH
jgi:hypothetical protein